MGKTLTSILTIAAAIAVNVIPGVGQFLSAAIGSTLATVAITAVTIAGLQSSLGLLGLGPSSPKPDTTETAIKTSRPPRVSAYGRSRLYGAWALYETASDGTAVDVYAVHQGEIDGIERRYLNDEQVTLTGTTVNQGADKRYKNGAINFYTTTGAVPGAGFPAIAALLGGSVWGANHRGDGVMAIALTAKSVKADDFQETYPSSSVPVPSVVCRWQKCPDPRAVDPLDESGWTWTENPVRHLLHYKLCVEGPRPALPRSDAGYDAALQALRAAWYARKIAPTVQYWKDAADDCDTARALKAGGSEARYRSSVAHKHVDKHQGPIAAILATFDGWLMPRSDGALVLYSGRYYAPTVTIGPDEIVSYTYDAGEPDEGDAVNEIIVSYISSAHDYNQVETDAWRDEANIAKRGQVLSVPLDAQIPSHAQGRALAKRLMQRKSAQHRGTCTTNIAGRGAMGQRFINLRLEEAGTVFYSGPVEITAARRTLRGGISFDWVAADANVDNWNPALEEGDPAPVGNRVAAQPLDAPTIDSTAAVYQAGSVYISIDAIGPNRTDLQWYVRTRETGAGVWGAEAKFADTDPGSTVTLVAGPVPGDTSIDVQVAYQVGDGRYSPWSNSATVNTSTAALPPAAPSDVAASGDVGEATVSWRNPNSSNFAYAKVWRNTANDFGTATDASGELPGGLGQLQEFVDTVAADDYWYWVVAYNADDVASPEAGPATATVT